jgi:hypothetical protein
MFYSGETVAEVYEKRTGVAVNWFNDLHEQRGVSPHFGAGLHESQTEGVPSSDEVDRILGENGLPPAHPKLGDKP